MTETSRYQPASTAVLMMLTNRFHHHFCLLLSADMLLGYSSPHFSHAPSHYFSPGWPVVLSRLTRSYVTVSDYDWFRRGRQWASCSLFTQLSMCEPADQWRPSSTWSWKMCSNSLRKGLTSLLGLCVPCLSHILEHSFLEQCQNYLKVAVHLRPENELAYVHPVMLC